MTKVRTSIVSVIVGVEERTVNFPMKFKTPEGETVDKFAKKIMYDLSITSVYDHGKVLTEVYTMHFYRKELRVIIPAISKYDQPQSLRHDEFKTYVESRWRKQHPKILSTVQLAVFGKAKKKAKTK